MNTSTDTPGNVLVTEEVLSVITLVSVTAQIALLSGTHVAAVAAIHDGRYPGLAVLLRVGTRTAWRTVVGQLA
jgi:hypothetical protein